MRVSLVLLVVLALLVVGVLHWPPFGATRELAREDDSEVDDARRARSGHVLTGLEAQLARWRHAGLLSDQQANAISDFEATLESRGAAHPRSRARVPAIAEAVGYIGAILALVGLGLIVARYWSDFNTPLRLTMSAVLALAFGFGGGLVHESLDAARGRLRSFLWLGASAATGLFCVVATRAVGAHEPRVEVVVLVTALVVGALSGALWRARMRPVQEFVALASVVVALGAVSRLLGTPSWMALGVFVSSYALVGLGVWRYVVTPWLAELVGALGLLVAAVMFVNFSQGPGGLLSVAGALGLIALAVARRPIRELGEARSFAAAGAIVLLQSLPPTLAYFAQNAGLVTGGLVFLASAFVMLLSVRVTMRGENALRILGALGVLLGAALTAVEYSSFGPGLGALSAVGLLVLGTRPGELGLSLVGSLGLLINVPWLIVELFPGQVRAPLVILITGALFVVLAVSLARERAGRSRDSGFARHRLRH